MFRTVFDDQIISKWQIQGSINKRKRKTNIFYKITLESLYIGIGIVFKV